MERIEPIKRRTPGETMEIYRAMAVERRTEEERRRELRERAHARQARERAQAKNSRGVSPGSAGHAADAAPAPGRLDVRG